MKKIIYSLWIEIPPGQFYMAPKLGVEKTQTSQLFKDNYNRLKQAHQKYANKIGVEYRLYEYDNDYQEYEKFFK